jgi:hypothetical protein
MEGQSMSIRNYSELSSSIAGWLKRTNLTDRIPDFITLAEASLNRQLRTRQMASIYMRTTDQNVITLPDDYLDAEKLDLNGITLTYSPRWTADQGTLKETSDPLYTMVGNNVWIMRRVDAGSVFRLFYYQRITPLSDAEPQNWLIEDAPDAYLYGSLMQAEPYLKNDPRIQIWSGLYSSIIETMNTNSGRSRASGSALVAQAS